MPAMKLYSFKIPADLADGLKRQKEQSGAPESETIRRALRAWLEQHGAMGKAASRRAGTRRKA